MNSEQEERIIKRVQELLSEHENLDRLHVNGIPGQTLKLEKKAVFLPIAITFVLTVAGWVYSAGIQAEKLSNTTTVASEAKENADEVPVIKTKVETIVEDIDEIKKEQRIIKNSQSLILQKLERIDEKLSNGNN